MSWIYGNSIVGLSVWNNYKLNGIVSLKEKMKWLMDLWNKKVCEDVNQIKHYRIKDKLDILDEENGLD